MNFETLSQWVSQHQTIITLVIIPVVFFSLTHWIANRTDQRAARDREAQRELSKQIKISEYEVEDMRELRRDLTDFISGLRAWRLKDNPSHYEVTNKYHKILLQLRRQEPSFHRFVEIADSLLEAPDFPDFFQKHEVLKSLSLDILEVEKARTYKALIDSDKLT